MPTTTINMGEVTTFALEDEEDYVINRDGKKEPMDYGKVTDRINDLTGLAYGKKLKFAQTHRAKIAQQVISRLKSGMTTLEIDDTVVSVCRTFSARHPDFSILAARFTVSNFQKGIQRTFPEVYKYLARDPTKSRIGIGFLEITQKFGEQIEEKIDYRRDFDFDGFGIGTVARSYLLKDPESENIAELPQQMYMRVAIAICCLRRSEESEPKGGMSKSEALLPFALEEAFRIYDLLSKKLLTHASPTIFNAGTVIEQYSSCFLAQVDDDFRNLYKVLADTANMSKMAGGVSISLDRMRAEGSLIRSSGGKSQGVSGYICVLNQSQQYANQGCNRPGAFAAYLSVHHADILTFLEMPLPRGGRFDQRKDGRFLKYGLWVPDLFWRTLAAEIDVNERVMNGEKVSEEEIRDAGLWPLFSPNTAPHLDEVFDERSIHHPDGPGGTYTQLVLKYIKEKRYVRMIRASELIRSLVHALGFTGNPYVLNKDNINRASNLTTPSDIKADGTVIPGITIVCSNLCAEISIPCRSRADKPEETLYGVCNLAAIPLPRHMKPDLTTPSGWRMDWVGIIQAAQAAARDLDKIIDINCSPAEGCERCNEKFRPIGVGVIGLADLFLAFGYSFGSEEAKALDAAVHACIYYGTMKQSSDRAATFGRDEKGSALGNYPSYRDSKAAKGLLQPDISAMNGHLNDDWESQIAEYTEGLLTPAMWDELRAAIRVNTETGEDGFLRNGYTTADMPTATSSNVVGGMTEGIDPPTALLYTRKTLAGEFIILNPHLIKAAEKLGIWNDDSSSMLEADDGSVQSWDGSNGRPFLPKEMRDVFKTAREIDQLFLAEHGAIRQSFLSQIQSLNTFWEKIVCSELLEYWLSLWSSGGGGTYYAHSQAKTGTQKMGVDRKFLKTAETDQASPAHPEGTEVLACPIDPALRAECSSCSV